MFPETVREVVLLMVRFPDPEIAFERVCALPFITSNVPLLAIAPPTEPFDVPSPNCKVPAEMEVVPEAVLAFFRTKVPLPPLVRETVPAPSWRTPEKTDAPLDTVVFKDAAPALLLVIMPVELPDKAAVFNAVPLRSRVALATKAPEPSALASATCKVPLLIVVPPL